MSIHIEAKQGDIATTVLITGGPLRARYHAERWLDAPVCFNCIRGMYGYTGTFKISASASHKIRSLSLLTVSDNIITQESLSPQDREQRNTDMMNLALSILSL